MLVGELRVTRCGAVVGCRCGDGERRAVAERSHLRQLRVTRCNVVVGCRCGDRERRAVAERAHLRQSAARSRWRRLQALRPRQRRNASHHRPLLLRIARQPL